MKRETTIIIEIDNQEKMEKGQEKNLYRHVKSLPFTE